MKNAQSNPLSWTEAFELAKGIPGSRINRVEGDNRFVVIFPAGAEVVLAERYGVLPKIKQLESDLAATLEERTRLTRSEEENAHSLAYLRNKIDELKTEINSLLTENAALKSLHVLKDVLTAEEIAILQKAKSTREKRAQRIFEDCPCQGLNENCLQCGGRGYIAVFNGFGERLSQYENPKGP